MLYHFQEHLGLVNIKKVGGGISFIDEDTGLSVMAPQVINDLDLKFKTGLKMEIKEKLKIGQKMELKEQLKWLVECIAKQGTFMYNLVSKEIEKVELVSGVEISDGTNKVVTFDTLELVTKLERKINIKEKLDMFKYEEIMGIKRGDIVSDMGEMKTSVLLVPEMINDTLEKINNKGFDKNLFQVIRDEKVNDYFKHFFYDRKGNKSVILSWVNLGIMVDSCVFKLWSKEINFFKEFKPENMEGRIEIKFLEDKVIITDTGTDLNVLLPKITEGIAKILDIQIDKSVGANEQLIDVVNKASQKGTFMIDLEEMVMEEVEVGPGVKISDGKKSITSFAEEDRAIIRRVLESKN